MVSFNDMTISLTVLISLMVLYAPSTTDASPYVLSDDRVRSLDITPLLGRGYSIMTNTFHSTCMMVDQATTPSYNYRYDFLDLTEFDSETRTEATLELSDTFAYKDIKEAIEKSEVTDSETSTTKHFVVATMRIERFYSSVQEQKSPLTPAALVIIGRSDYIGFFKSCGANYIRGIRRAQEMSAIFSFESSSSTLAQEFATSLKSSSTSLTSDASTGSTSSGITDQAKFDSINNSLNIQIVGFGLGLNADNGTLVASTLEEYNEVMKYAFRAMTQTKGEGLNIGMVYGIEVVPWVDNTEFQVSASIYDEAVEIPLTRSSIPKSFKRTNRRNSTFVEAERDSYVCATLTQQIDKYGYCCENRFLFNTTTFDYDPTMAVKEAICRPIRALDKSLVKNNMASNGEFVARLDSLLTYKLNQLSTLEMCLSEVRSIPKSYEHFILKPQDSVKYDRDLLNIEFTLKHMQIALDPFNDYRMITFMGREIEEYVDQFYVPCINAMFGASFTQGSADTEYFLAYPWHSHQACLHLSCLTTGMRWDRKNGGCKAGLMVGVNAEPYYEGENPRCKYDESSSEDECKYPAAEMNSFTTSVIGCWNTTQPTGRLDYFLNNYCLPRVSSVKLSDANKESLDANYGQCNKTYTV